MVPEAQIVDRLIQDAVFQIESFTAQHVELAREAYARYGKGRDAAGLNYGDCFSYALAKATGLPLISRGRIFQRRTWSRSYPTLETKPGWL